MHSKPVLAVRAAILLVALGAFARSASAANSYATFFGKITDGQRGGRSVALDAAGYVYVLGEVLPNQTFPDPLPPTSPLQEVFVAKLDPAGQLLWVTYLEARGCGGLAVEPAGRAHVLVQQFLDAAPTATLVPGLTEVGGGYFRLGSDGAIEYSAPLPRMNDSGINLFMGDDTSPYNFLRGIALDAQGNAYVAGLGTRGLPQADVMLRPANAGQADCFVMKIDVAANRIAFATWLGGSYDDVCAGVAVDPGGGVYVAGTTQSPDFPLVNPAQPSFGAWQQIGWGIWSTDAFVARLSPTGDALVWSTFLGGGFYPASTDTDVGRAIAVDASGNAFVVGMTMARDFPVTVPNAPGDPWANSWAEFAVKYAPDGSVAWSRILSGLDGYFPYGGDLRAVALDADGGLFVAGADGRPGTLARLDPDDGAPLTQVDAFTQGRVNGIAAAPGGTLWWVGFCVSAINGYSYCHPTPDAIQSIPLNGYTDAFIGNSPTFLADDASCAEGATAVLTAVADDRFIYRWDLDGDGFFEIGWSPDSSSVSYPCVDGPSTNRVSVAVSDGHLSWAKPVVHVTNEPPVVSAPAFGASAPRAGTDAPFAADFVDPGVADAPFTALYAWGDGTTSPAAVSEAGGAGTALASHVFGTPDYYAVAVTITDKDGGAGSATAFVPVHGGAGKLTTAHATTFESPAGALAGAPGTAGLAQLEVSVAYPRNPSAPSVPSGSLSFSFANGGLSLVATSFDFLVMPPPGDRAFLQGVGSVNGASGYGFAVAVRDSSKTASDSVRVRIWELGTGAVLYDTAAGAPPNAVPDAPVLASGDFTLTSW